MSTPEDNIDSIDEMADALLEAASRPKKVSKSRNRKASYSVQELAKDFSEEMIYRAVHIARHADNESTQLDAIKLLLDRGFGKATVKAQINTTYTSTHETIKALAETVKAPPQIKMEEDDGDVINVEAKEVVTEE